MTTYTTQELFRDHGYQQTAAAKVIATQINDQGHPMIALDQTIFYIHGGGQPGDQGTLSTKTQQYNVVNTLRDRESGVVWHVLGQDTTLPVVGDTLQLQLDWDTRYARMKMHTALHLLCSIVPLGVTGGQIGAEKSRLDFDTNLHSENLEGETPFIIDKIAIEEKLNRLISENHPVTTHWVDDTVLQQRPDMVRTMSVKPPTNADGRLRLVQIGGADYLIDLQPCGGTHVAHTSEIGRLKVGKIENKGARNKRINLLLD